MPGRHHAANQAIAALETTRRLFSRIFFDPIHARPGAETRHNPRYWHNGDCAGIGPGAHGRVTLGGRLLATRRHRAPEPWAERVERDGHGRTEETSLSPDVLGREMPLMGLRLAEGVRQDRFLARTGRALRDAIDPEGFRLAAEEGYLVWHDGRLIATVEGRRRLDALLPVLVR